jgi:hypothetical protein
MNNAFGFYESDIQNDLKNDFSKQINLLENKFTQNLIETNNHIDISYMPYTLV